MACAQGDTINVKTYQALHTTIDLDGLYDILEMVEIHNSWQMAARLNVEEGAPSG